jgi:hypothetical protein
MEPGSVNLEPPEPPEPLEPLEPLELVFLPGKKPVKFGRQPESVEKPVETALTRGIVWPCAGVCVGAQP